MKRQVHGGHVKWTVCAMRLFCHIIPEKKLCIRSAFHARSYGPNLKSPAQIVLKIFWIVCGKIYGSRDISHAHFGKIIWALARISQGELWTKFEVSSSDRFEYIFDCLPEIVWVTWPRPRPLWGKLFERPLGFHQTNRCTKFEVFSSSSFADIFDCLPKMRVHVT